MTAKTNFKRNCVLLNQKKKKRGIYDGYHSQYERNNYFFTLGYDLFKRNLKVVMFSCFLSHLCC